MRAAARRLRDAYRRMRLGTRLTLGLGVLSLAVFAVVGTALTAYMRDYLEQQLGKQLKLIQAVQAKDYPLMQGLFLVITFAVLIANLIADMAYVLLDPRTRSEV